MSAPIEVLAIRPFSASGSVKAFVDFRCGAIVVKGAKIIRQEGQRAWLAMPSVKSERAWNNVVEITSKDLRQRITDVVLAAWEERLRAVAASTQPIEQTPFHDDWREAVADLEGRGR